MKISAFTIISEADKYNYPYLESIQSFLPLCDEVIVVYNILKPDKSLEKIKELNEPKIKIIDGLFDYERFGWASQGIMRTNGYYASTGDMVIMFDADGILHENDVDKTRDVLNQVYNNKTAYGFFMKHRIFKPDILIRQAKHSGFFNKSVLGNNFNFYGKAQYAPNWGMLSKEQERGQQIDTYIWGYERVWDTKEIFEEKLKFRRIMEKSAHKVPDEETYISNYLDEVQNRISGDKQFATIEEHSKIIQDKLKQITPEHFGYNNFKDEM